MWYYDDVLEHHGILGQKWGVRRFQNKNGTLTSAGRKRYDEDSNYKKVSKSSTPKSSSSEDNTSKKKGLTDKQKKMIIAGAAVVGTAVAAYGGYKLYQLNKEATEGLSDKYHNMAKKSFFDANDYAAKAQKFHMEGNFGKERYGADNLGVQAAKIGEEYFDNQSKLAKDLGRQLQDKAKAKDFSVKEKADYLKSKKEATNKLASEASSLAKSVTAQGPQSFTKPAQNAGQVKSQMTTQKYQAATRTINSGSKATSNTIKIAGQQKFNQAAKANDDLVQELLKKNTIRF